MWEKTPYAYEESKLGRIRASSLFPFPFVILVASLHFFHPLSRECDEVGTYTYIHIHIYTRRWQTTTERERPDEAG